MMKTIERAHQPANMWEKIRLSHNYETALKQVRIDLHNSIYTWERQRECITIKCIFYLIDR